MLLYLIHGINVITGKIRMSVLKPAAVLKPFVEYLDYKSYKLHVKEKIHGLITIELDQLAVGKVISYTLPRSMRPTKIDKVWRGRIIAVYRTRFGDVSGVNVESMETGYEGLQELVFPYQMRSIE